MERRNLSPADMSRQIGADKSVISRWLSGASPTKVYQERLAALFSIEPHELFRHPDDNWLARFFAERAELMALLKERDAEELDRIEKMIRLTFPPKAANG
jgi:transcriptional regulator with XRE-family HTH domain